MASPWSPEYRVVPQGGIKPRPRNLFVHIQSRNKAQHVLQSNLTAWSALCTSGSMAKNSLDFAEWMLQKCPWAASNARHIPLLLFHVRVNLPAVNNDGLPYWEKQRQARPLGHVTSQVGHILPPFLADRILTNIMSEQWGQQTSGGILRPGWEPQKYYLVFCSAQPSPRGGTS